MMGMIAVQPPAGVDGIMDNWPLIALIAGLIVERFFSGLKSRGIDLQKMAIQTSDLHDWHDKEDADGTKIWYSTKGVKSMESLEKSVETLTSVLTKQNEKINDLVTAQTIGAAEMKSSAEAARDAAKSAEIIVQRCSRITR